ncbi:putative adenosine monophosphate-protein transferase Fic [Klebsiella variicola]|uniref:putative adenosine monophosphate-protein transferase Fic n=1 Tax=Klebsiella variicola TaxID=244366 RepID=UPI000D750552|nr:putative adenosine monophosphate-protein transferase Fic [Klebsiella variicola]PXK80070.1 putative adenosine monophosphate-protein transferase Fic [Klebsiella variicola]
MSDKFGDERDPYLYPALNVLRNRLGIRQAKNLQQAAFEMTALRAATLPLGPRVRGLPYLCAIHHQLYQDLFDWAGRLREVNLYLGDTPFCHFARIEEEGNALMQALELEDYLNGLPRETFIERLSWFYGEINVLHPFRLGNGLTQRIFFEQLAIHAGYLLDWRDVDPAGWSAACQQSAMGDPAPLVAIFRKVVSDARESE